MTKEPKQDEIWWRWNMVPHSLFGIRVFVQQSKIQLVSQTEPKFLCKRMLSLTLSKYAHKHMHSHVLTYTERPKADMWIQSCELEIQFYCMPQEIRFLFAFTIHITARATAIAPCTPSHKFNVVSLRQMLRRKKAPIIAIYKLFWGAGSSAKQPQPWIFQHTNKSIISRTTAIQFPMQHYPPTRHNFCN